MASVGMLSGAPTPFEDYRDVSIGGVLAQLALNQLGLEPFRNLLNDARFAHVPMYLETAKGIEDNEDLDVRNLRVLRSLVRSPKRR